ncbi:MAG: hypothetical protein COA58_11370 [Bacteroidetes bacterium]|nr:MAG: hypothetical protein COA58_11370 [Bacteroidota bacterium]
MKKILFISFFILNLLGHSYGQVSCEDYKIVSIFDIPPTPQTPGGNYFLLLLTLDADNLNNIDIYANLFFTNDLGDTISIPTGPSSTLPRYASDTILYILKLNSTSSNQDFPENFKGKLVIVHITQLICEVDYSNVLLSTNNANTDSEITIFPNPFVNFIRIESDKLIRSILVVGYDGRTVDKSYPKAYSHQINMEKLSMGVYSVVVQFENGETGIYKVIKI